MSADPRGPVQTNFHTTEPKKSAQNKNLHSQKPDPAAVPLQGLAVGPKSLYVTVPWGRAGKQLGNLTG
jgi:hypothetical protein